MWLTWLTHHPSILAVPTVVDSPAIVGALGQIGLVARAPNVVQPDGSLPLSIMSKPAHTTPIQYINPSFTYNPITPKHYYSDTSPLPSPLLPLVLSVPNTHPTAFFAEV